MKTLLLLLAIFGTSQAKTHPVSTSQKLNNLTRSGFLVPTFEDVALEMAGTLQVNKGKPERFQLSVSRAYFEDAGITLEGHATYGDGCETQVCFKSGFLFMGYQTQPLNLFSWSESPVRCSRKKAVLWYADQNSAGAGGTLNPNALSRFLYDNFVMGWGVRNLLSSPSKAKTYSFIQLTLKATTSSYVRIHLPLNPRFP